MERIEAGVEIKKPQAVFFDWDGTLADSFEFLYAAHSHVCRTLGRAVFSLTAFEGYFGQPREKLYRELYGEHMEEARTHFERYVLDNHLAGLKPAKGAEALLSTLRALEIPCGVVSNKKRNLIEAEIENFGWKDFFLSVVGAGEAKEDKPSPAPLHLAMERAGLSLPTAHIWFIGDTDNDLICGDKAGCVTVLVERKAVYDKLSVVHRVDLHRNNCSELNEFLLQYGGKGIKVGAVGNDKNILF